MFIYKVQKQAVFWTLFFYFYHKSANSEPSSSVIVSIVGYFIEAAEFVREKDPSRLVAFTGGFEGAGDENDSLEYPKLLIDKLDVVAINTYSGINDGNDEAPIFDTNYTKLEILTKFKMKDYKVL